MLASSLMIGGLMQPALSSTTSVSKPQRITSKLILTNLLLKHHTNRFSNLVVYDSAMPSLAQSSSATSPSAKAGAVSAAAMPSSTNTAVSHSTTNIQVQGVDESDIVKVGDDGYLYQIYNNQIRVIKAFPIIDLAQEASLKFPDDNFTPSGLYLQNNTLIVMGSAWQTLTPLNTTSKMAYSPIYCCWWGGYSQTRIFLYDVSDHANPKQIRDVTIDGDFLDSRLINNNLFFVTRTYPRYYMYGNVTDTSTLKPADILPSIVDNKNGQLTKRVMSVTDVSYFPEFVEPDYVIVSSLALDQPTKNVVTKAYLGAGEMVYASLQNLYLSASKYNFSSTWGMPDEKEAQQNSVNTQIYKFDIQNGLVTFKAAGEVAGTVLNQFSMDENNRHFRIATTSPRWYSATNESYNSLFVLDENMKTIGSLENIAKGEQIYSTRFIGDRCYMVTFRLTDPLFTIDLSVPEKPIIMGELKIPGYSNYLHPYDENHLIGFGKDAAIYTSEKQTNADQFWNGGSAFYQGLKLALFDVSDIKNPKELHSITIGDRGTDSPLLWNHKALYWDNEKHLFGLPLEIHTLPKGFDKNQPWQYGQSTFQGAYVYAVTPEKGFELKAKLSNFPITITLEYNGDQNYLTLNNYFIDRLLRIDSNLYTLSPNQLNAYDLENYNLKGKLSLKP